MSTTKRDTISTFTMISGAILTLLTWKGHIDNMLGIPVVIWGAIFLSVAATALVFLISSAIENLKASYLAKGEARKREQERLARAEKRDFNKSGAQAINYIAQHSHAGSIFSHNEKYKGSAGLLKCAALEGKIKLGVVKTSTVVPLPNNEYEGLNLAVRMSSDSYPHVSECKLETNTSTYTVFWVDQEELEGVFPQDYMKSRY